MLSGKWPATFGPIVLHQRRGVAHVRGIENGIFTVRTIASSLQILNKHRSGDID